MSPTTKRAALALVRGRRAIDLVEQVVEVMIQNETLSMDQGLALLTHLADSQKSFAACAAELSKEADRVEEVRKADIERLTLHVHSLMDEADKTRLYGIARSHGFHSSVSFLNEYQPMGIDESEDTVPDEAQGENA